MRETFEEAYNGFVEGMKNIGLLSKVIAEVLIWFTVPIWVLPYMIIRRLTND